MQFKKEDLQNLTWDEPPDYLTVIRDEIIGKGRWDIQHELVFTFDGKLYRTYYSEGATEYQDERPFEYEPDLIECDEVIRIPITSYNYIKKTELNADKHIDLTNTKDD